MSLQYGDDGAAWVEKLNKAAGKGKQPVKQPVVSNKKGTVAYATAPSQCSVVNGRWKLILQKKRQEI